MPDCKIRCLNNKVLLFFKVSPGHKKATLVGGSPV